jgi:hypothetical protein
MVDSGRDPSMNVAIQDFAVQDSRCGHRQLSLVHCDGRAVEDSQLKGYGQGRDARCRSPRDTAQPLWENRALEIFSGHSEYPIGRAPSVVSVSKV